MARQSQDREDLLRDAKAFVPRVMLRAAILGITCEVFAGFRGDCLSLYFDGDPVYHFNSRGELRRAFVRDQIIKAIQGDLWIWQADRKPDAVIMLSRPMTADEWDYFSEKMSRQIDALRMALDRGIFDFVGQFPHDVDVLRKLGESLQTMRGFAVAQAANVG